MVSIVQKGQLKLRELKAPVGLLQHTGALGPSRDSIHLGGARLQLPKGLPGDSEACSGPSILVPGTCPGC